MLVVYMGYWLVNIFFVKLKPIFQKPPSKHHAQTEGTLANTTIETNMDNVFRKPLDM